MAHSNRATSLQDISDVFSVFHDGTPEDWNVNNDTLSLKISCLYIAELVSPEFEYFFLELDGLQNLEFKPWEPFDKDHPELTLIQKLNECDFEIITSEFENSQVKIFCHEHNSFFGTPGGDICLTADTIIIRAENDKVISIEQLKSFSKSYWDKFSKK